MTFLWVAIYFSENVNLYKAKCLHLFTYFKYLCIWIEHIITQNPLSGEVGVGVPPLLIVSELHILVEGIFICEEICILFH